MVLHRLTDDLELKTDASRHSLSNIDISQTESSSPRFFLLFLSLVQTPVCWQVRGRVTPTPCGDWLTVASRTASCPAQPTGRLNCGTQRRKSPALAPSTLTWVSLLTATTQWPQGEGQHLKACVFVHVCPFHRERCPHVSGLQRL